MAEKKSLEKTEAPAEQKAMVATDYDYGDLAGQGFDNQTSEDISIPFLGVLQPMSPEVERGNAAQIENAAPGMLFNTVTNELLPEAIAFQPVDTRHCFVEWVPRKQGGGLVGIHELDSEVVRKAKEESETFGAYQTPKGNDLVETFYVLGHRLLEDGSAEPMMIAFTSTKIKVYKQIMTRLRTFRGRPPLFAHRLSISTSIEKNAKGTFYNFKIAPLVKGDVGASLIPPKDENGEPHPLLVAGKTLLAAFRGQEMKVNYEKQGGASGGAETEEEIPF